MLAGYAKIQFACDVTGNQHRQTALERVLQTNTQNAFETMYRGK